MLAHRNPLPVESLRPCTPVPARRPSRLAQIGLWGVTIALLLAPTLLEAQATPGRGQGNQFTVLAGASFSSLRGVEGVEHRTGSALGVSLLRPLLGPISLQPEVIAVGRGIRFENREDLDFQVVELPLLLRLSVNPRARVTPHLYGGPYLGLHLSCSVRGSDLDCDELPEVRTETVEVGGILGGGVNLLAGPFLLTGGGRYGFGVSSMAEFDRALIRESARHGGWMLYVGAGIRLGG
jgi:hypothetical protein